MGGDHPDPAVAGVGDHHVPGAVQRKIGRLAQLGLGGRAAVAGEATAAVAGDGVDVPGGHRHPVERALALGHHPDPVVNVNNHQVSRRVYLHRDRIEPRAEGRTAVSGEPAGAVAGNGVDVPGLHRLPVEGAGAARHHPDPAGLEVGDHQVPGVVFRHSARAHGRAGGRPAVADRPAQGVRARERGQQARSGAHLLHRPAANRLEARIGVVAVAVRAGVHRARLGARLGDVEVAVLGEGHTAGLEGHVGGILRAAGAAGQG